MVHRAEGNKEPPERYNAAGGDSGSVVGTILGGKVHQNGVQVKSGKAALPDGPAFDSNAKQGPEWPGWALTGSSPNTLIVGSENTDEIRPGKRPGGAPGSAAPAAVQVHPGLPCQKSEQLHWERKGSGGVCSKPARRLVVEISSLVNLYGVNRLGFLTLSFPDDVTTIQEASRRFHSLNSNFLRKRKYDAWIAAVHRHKDGKRIHFHLVVVCPVDIRTGFDFEGVKRRRYGSACAWLRAEWRAMREGLSRYGFGRAELLPVRTDGYRAATYIGRYLSRSEARGNEKGFRLVRYSRRAWSVCGKFTWWDFKAKRAQERLARCAEFLGLSSVAAMETEFGRKMMYVLKRWVYGPEGQYEYIGCHVEQARRLYAGTLEFMIEDAFADWDARGAWYRENTIRGTVFAEGGIPCKPYRINVPPVGPCPYD